LALQFWPVWLTIVALCLLCGCAPLLRPGPPSVISLVNKGFLATWADLHLTALVAQLLGATVLFVLMWECDPWFFVSIQGIMTASPNLNYSDTMDQYAFRFDEWKIDTALMGSKAKEYCVAPIVPLSWLPLNASNPPKLNFWAACELGGDDTCGSAFSSDSPPDCFTLWSQNTAGGVQIGGKDYYSFVQSAELTHQLPIHDPVLDDVPIVIQWEDPMQLKKHAQDVLIGMLVSFEMVFVIFLIARPYLYRRWKFLWLLPKGFIVPANTPNVAGGPQSNG